MRVIAGSARHLQLKTIEGTGTRPTTDRIKETLFNLIAFEVSGSRFLDLFSGSGGIGIEALSRGAVWAVFVENNRRAADCIRQNLAHTHMQDHAQLLVQDVFDALHLLERRGESFRYIFMDPPYGQLLEKRVLFALKDSVLCDEKTQVIAESDLFTDYPYLEETGFRIVKEKKYKTNKHTFFMRTAAMETSERV